MTALGRPKALIGMVHVGALPGTPYGDAGIDEIVDVAAREAGILAESGFDAIVIENMHDRPYVHGRQAPEIVASMTRAGLAVREAAGELALGVQVLSGGNREAVAIAQAVGASFVRCENFVFAHVADEGLLAEAEAGGLLRYRRSIGAEDVQIFVDIKKKHASHALTADIPIDEAARAAEFFGADGVIVTGVSTGRPTDPGDVAKVREATGLPVLVGSGVTPDQMRTLYEHADALIVGSWIKKAGVWSNPVDPARCREIVGEARRVRQ
jgi:membrane complex biogenesis BtpA family protein